MKKLIISIIIFTVLLSGVAVLPQHAFAEDTPNGSAVSTGAKNLGTNLVAQFFQYTSLLDLINSAVATFVNWAMAAAGFLLSTSAYVLDVSINLTLNIKAFVEATPAIYSVWRILRDITGLFFIFYLLYAATQMMTGFGKGGSYASTVKNIIIAGVLINFSFFIVSVSIDFSNVISQAIYNAMIPDEVVMRINPKTNLSEMVANAGKSNISNIFMNSLRIQKIYDTNGNYLGTNISDPVKTALIGIAGVVMMITTAASFILAALAFIARLIILIFLLAFSSLWFVGWIIPEVNKHFSMFQGQLFNQLIFMPAYLLLMYVGLTIINGSNLLGAGNIATMSATGTNWIMPYVLIIVNFAIVIVILNLPLAVALGMGGMATGWLKKSISTWDAKSVWKNIGGWTSGTIGTNLAGRAASKADNWLGNTRPGNSLLGRSIRSNTTGLVANSKFGGSRKYSEIADAAKERGKKGAEIRRNIEFNNLFKEARTGKIAPANVGKLKTALKQMTWKEKLALGTKTFKENSVIKHLGADDFKNIREDKDGNFSEKDKMEISDKRYEVLEAAISDMDTDTIKHMIGTMDGKDLLKANNAIQLNPQAVEYMKISQLKLMGEEGLSAANKNAIKTEINHIGTSHSAYGWVNKNW
jgi:hypothetical protein